MTRKTEWRVIKLGSRINQPAAAQEIAETANNTNPQPLVVIFNATQMAPAMPVQVPVHFNTVMMRPHVLLAHRPKFPLGDGLPWLHQSAHYQIDIPSVIDKIDPFAIPNHHEFLLPL